MIEWLVTPTEAFNRKKRWLDTGGRRWRATKGDGSTGAMWVSAQMMVPDSLCCI